MKTICGCLSHYKAFILSILKHINVQIEDPNLISQKGGLIIKKFLRPVEKKSSLAEGYD